VKSLKKLIEADILSNKTVVYGKPVFSMEILRENLI